MRVERHPLFSIQNGKEKRVMDYIVKDGIEILEYKVKNIVVSVKMDEIQRQIYNIKKQMENY